jgi:DNA-directed RNA polymerase specialized sigma24 family protein
LDGSPALIIMAVTLPDEPSAPSPEWETIEQIFAALESPLLSYARRLLGDFSLAEDLVQEAFMKLHAQFQKVLSPQPWL